MRTSTTKYLLGDTGSGEILHAVEVGVAGIVGVADMLVGDRRKITVPPRMGYVFLDSSFYWLIILDIMLFDSQV